MRKLFFIFGFLQGSKGSEAASKANPTLWGYFVDFFEVDLTKNGIKSEQYRYRCA